MLHEFTIENILSFKEPQTLSFEATSDETYESEYCVEVKPGLKLLKLAIIYGANASGKTNLLLALNMLRSIVLNPKDDKYEAVDFLPFLLDDESRDENGKFYLSFFIQGKRYIYSIDLNEEYIESEKLVYYPTTQPALIFERTYNKSEKKSNVKFGNKLQASNKESIILEGNTIRNSPLLAVYTKTNITLGILDDVIAWFKNTLMEAIRPSTKLMSWTSRKIEESETCKEFVLEALKKADLNISNIKIEEIEEDIDEELADIIESSENIPRLEKEKLLKEKKLILKDVSFVHDLSSGEYKLPYKFQSSGTQRYYGLGGVLSVLLNNMKILPIDEIETSLHYDLISHFIKTFIVNSTSSQLIFTTHDINLMSEDYLRRDVIWFTQKNKAGGTELIPASDFKLHKNASIFNAYKIGKLGAKPELGDIFLDKFDEYVEEEAK